MFFEFVWFRFHNNSIYKMEMICKDYDSIGAVEIFNWIYERQRTHSLFQ